MPKRTFDKLSFPARTAITVGTCALFSLLLCLAFSFISYMSDDPSKNFTLYGEICYLLTMLFCGFIGAKLNSENRFASGIISGCAMLVLTALGAIVLSDNAVKSLILAALGMFLCAAGAAVGSREPKRKRRR